MVLMCSAGLRRRGVLRAGLGTGALLAMPAIARAQGAFDWKRYQGQKLEVLLPKSPRSDLAQKLEREFVDLTGIRVGSEQIPEQQQRQKLVVEFASGRTSFDVVVIAPHVQKKMAAKAGWLEDLRPLLADPAQTAPDYDFADMTKPAVQFTTQPDGRLDMLPLNLDYWTLYWNQEMFAAKGIEYPKTLDDVLAAARALTDPKAGVSGVTMRGIKNANTLVWTSFLLGWGVDSISSDGTMHTDGPEAVAAAQLYQALARECAPAGTVGFNWNECQTTFAQGRAAMWFDSSGFAFPLEDKTRSKVAGKVGYGVMPAGPKAHQSGLTGDGIGISRSSQRKGPAWLYVQWVTGKAMMARQLIDGYGVPPRRSSFEAVKTAADVRASKDWLACMAASAPLAHPALPEIVAVTEFRDTFGVALANMVGGADAGEELRKASAAFKPVLAKTEA